MDYDVETKLKLLKTEKLWFHTILGLVFFPLAQSSPDIRIQNQFPAKIVIHDCLLGEVYQFVEWERIQV